MNDFGQRIEVLNDGLVNKDIAVSQVEDFLLQVALDEAIDNLESCESLASAGSHNQKEALLSASNGIQSPVNSHLLIIPGRVLACVEGLVDDLDLFC